MIDFKQMFEAAPAAICLHLPDGRIVSANPAFCRLLGYPEAELAQMSFWQLIPAADQPSRREGIASLPARRQTCLQGEYRYLHKAGHTLWLIENRALLSDGQDPSAYFICHYQDITQRKQNEQRLLLIRERYNLSQRHANFGVWDWNIQTNDLYWSEHIGPLFGYADKEVEANYADFIAAVHPEDREYVNAAVRAAVEDHAEYDIAHRIVWPDGSVRWIRETGDVIRSDDGSPVNMIGVARDVTDHHNAEVALIENAEQLKQAQAIAHLGHWSWDVASGKLYWSDEIYRIFGYRPGEIEPTYEKFLATLHPDDIERIKQSEERAFAEGKPHSIDHRIIRHDGSEVWVHEEGVAITGEQGQPVRLTGTVQDITERKRLEQQLADKIEQAEAANFAKSAFLSHMSHELRTPLNGILGFAQILDMENLPESASKSVKEIISSGWHLLDLVDDLLDLSRIETGHIDLHMEHIMVRALLMECQSMIEPMLIDRKLRCIPSYMSCDALVLADRRRLKQVIINLLSNAVKYNRPGGEVEISYRQADGKLRIMVRDTGQGIPPEHMQRLFTPFDRLGKEGIEESGTGIGLTLVKRLTEHMQGAIGVESTLGEGSVFWVEFPLSASGIDRIAEQHNDYHKKNIGQPAAGITILCVEDNPANLRLIEGFVAKHEHLRLLVATTATAGLDMAKQRRPDIILMDIKLPDMNGFEALALLRTFPETAEIPVIAVSAIAHEHDIAAGLNAGFYRYLTKPLKLQELDEAIYYALQGKNQPN